MALSQNRVEALLDEADLHMKSASFPGSLSSSNANLPNGRCGGLRQSDPSHTTPRLRRNGTQQYRRSQLGTFLEPRPSTDPRIDSVAKDVAEVILEEPENQRSFLQVRQCYSMPVAVGADGIRWEGDGERAAAIVHEWNVSRIINDRVWDWMQWMSRNAPATKRANPPLPEGYFRANLYHQCGTMCNEMRTNLLKWAASAARKASPISLTACPVAGVVHMCRANSISCTVLEETDDTQLVCQESGMVCHDVGVHMSGAGDMRFMKAQRGIEFEMGTRAGGSDRSPSDPESMRRAAAIELMRATCPQIVGWDADTGELTVDMNAVPDQARGETFFDPSFYWIITPPPLETRYGGGEYIGNATGRENRTSSMVMVTQSLGGDPVTHLGRGSAKRGGGKSYVSSVGTMVHAMQTAKKRWQRSSRSKRMRFASKHRHRQCVTSDQPGGGAASTSDCVGESELLLEQETVERVLDHVLWDAETRRRVNEEGRGRISEIVSAQIREQLKPQSAGDILTSLAKQHQEKGCDSKTTKFPLPVANPPVCLLTADAVHATCISTLKEHLVPVMDFDKRIHDQLVKVVLYLWTFIVHIPDSVVPASEGGDGGPTESGVDVGGSKHRGGYHPKKRRNHENPAVSLTQFTLAVLYTAASSGICVDRRLGWPKDWWLADHLPNRKMLHLFHGAKQRLSEHRRLRQTTTPKGRDRTGVGGETGILDHISVVGAAKHPTANLRKRKEPVRRDYQPETLYDNRGVARGNKELVAALCTYDGLDPTPDEVASFLHRAYTEAYDSPQGPLSLSKNTAEVVDKSKRGKRESGNLSTTSTTTATTTTTMQNRERTPVRFCCMFVPQTHHSGDGTVFQTKTASPSRPVHICVMFDPYDPEGPPMLRKYSSKVLADWGLDTVIGPFVYDIDARNFCVEWARDRCRTEARRAFGIQLAQRLGLRIWVEDRGNAVETMDCRDEEACPPPFPGMAQPLVGGSQHQRQLIAHGASSNPIDRRQGGGSVPQPMCDMWAAFSIGGMHPDPFGTERAPVVGGGMGRFKQTEPTESMSDLWSMFSKGVAPVVGDGQGGYGHGGACVEKKMYEQDLEMDESELGESQDVEMSAGDASRTMGGTTWDTSPNLFDHWKMAV